MSAADEVRSDINKLDTAIRKNRDNMTVREIELALDVLSAMQKLVDELAKR